MPDFRTLLNALEEPALLLDETRVVAVNDAFLAELAGEECARDDLEGREVDDLADSLDESVATMLLALRSGGPSRARGHVLFAAGCDTPLRKDVTSTPLGDEGRLRLVRFFPHDPASAALLASRRSDRLRILGILAAATAHDLNNQLSAVVNATSLLSSEATASEPSRRRAILDLLESSAANAAAIARRLLRFSGRGTPAIERVSPREALGRVLDLLRHELEERARVAVRAPEDGGEVLCDPIRLEHLLALLLLEARRRAGPEGEVGSEVRTVTLDTTRSVGGMRLAPGPYAVIEIACAPERARGGAADAAAGPTTARELARELGGTLVEEDDGRVYVWRLLLPAAAAAAADGAASGERSGGGEDTRAEEPSGEGLGRVRVLVVDADRQVRGVARAMVERIGHEAVVVGDPALAFERLEREDVDLVLFDLSREDDLRVELLAELRRRHPDVRVVVSWAFGGAGRSDVNGVAVDAILRKPYTHTELASALEKALSRA